MTNCNWVEDIRQKYKVWNMALFDWTFSLFAAFLIGWFAFKLRRNPVAWFVWIITWVLLGVVVHKIVGIDTMFGYYLGINPYPTRKQCV